MPWKVPWAGLQPREPRLLRPYHHDSLRWVPGPGVGIGGIPVWLLFGGFGAVVTAAIILVAAMVLGGNGGDPVQVAGPPTGEIANVKQAIKRVYQLINDQRWLDVWESYTPEFRKECSYNSYKSHTQGVTFRNFRNRSVTGFSDIEIQGRIALATFNVAYDSPEGGRLVMTVR